MNTADATRNSRKNDGKKERKGIRDVATGDGFYYIRRGSLSDETSDEQGDILIAFCVYHLLCKSFDFTSFLLITYILYHKFLKKSNYFILCI